MPTYQPGVGLYIADTLNTSDVGNVPSSTRARNPDGTPGRLNGDAATQEGTIYFREAGTSDGYLSPADIGTYTPSTGGGYGLCSYFGVVPRTIERWFGIPGANGQVQYRNCVPLAAVGKRVFTLSQSEGTRPYGPNVRDGEAPTMSFQRLVLAACLCVDGGLQRTPIMSGGTANTDGSRGGGKGSHPFLETFEFSSLSDALRWTIAMLDGNISVVLQQGWVQITFDTDGAGGWDVNVFLFYPRASDASDYADFPDGGDEELGDENEE